MRKRPRKRTIPDLAIMQSNPIGFDQACPPLATTLFYLSYRRIFFIQGGDVNGCVRLWFTRGIEWRKQGTFLAKIAGQNKIEGAHIDGYLCDLTLCLVFTMKNWLGGVAPSCAIWPGNGEDAPFT
jgi:hypothetical protein